MPDYVPNDDTEFAAWLTNISVQATANSAALGLTTAETTRITELSAAFTAALALAQQKKAESTQATASKNTLRKATAAAMRGFANRMKTGPGYTDSGLGASLGIVGGRVVFDPNQVKPVLALTSHPGHVRIDFVKNGIDGLKIFTRLRGAATWDFLAFATVSPYLDERPPASPGQPGVREYQAIAIHKDKEIGHFSDISSIVFPG